MSHRATHGALQREADEKRRLRGFTTPGVKADKRGDGYVQIERIEACLISMEGLIIVVSKCSTRVLRIQYLGWLYL